MANTTSNTTKPAAAKPKANPNSAKPPTAPARSTGGLPQNKRGANKR